MNKFTIIVILLLFFFGNLFVSQSSKRHRRKTSKKSYKILYDTLLSPGIIYRHIYYGHGRTKNSVHILEADLNNPFISIAVLKAFGQVNELQSLHKMINRFDSLHKIEKVIAAINANFWKAYSNRPINPTVIDGEVLEMKTHKKWTSGFFDEASFLYIDTFFIQGMIKIKNKTLHIKTVNRRFDSTGIVLYNKFGGDTIPYVSSAALCRAFYSAISDTSLFNDSTEARLDTNKLMEEIKVEKRFMMTENQLPKIKIQYLTFPAVNKVVSAIVTEKIDSGLALMPKNGAILSFGYDFDKRRIPNIGDTIKINFKTNVYDSIVFINAVGGTPRLVRKGRARNEARKEGSKRRRFINRALPRTAIGTNKSKNKIYFVVVAPNNKIKKTRGASLSRLAYIMKNIGCYDAMNLDGGSSATMIIDGKNLLRANPYSSRNISVGLALIQILFGPKGK